MVCLYRETYNAYYYASFFSISSLITIVSVIVLLLLPFFLQFSTINENFWYTPSVYYEHPVIRYNDEYAILVGYENNNEYKTFYATSNSDLTEFYNIEQNSDLSINSFTVRKEEVNNDDVIDVLNVNINLYKSDGVTIKDIKIILFLDYILQSNVKYQFQTICFIDAYLSNGINELKTKGKLKLKQKLPFKMTDFYNKTYSSNYFQTHGILGSDFSSIYENFTNGRDYTTKYEYIYKNIIPQNDDNNDNSIDINSIIEIPSYQEVIFGMPSYMNLKMKWIRYLAAFIPTYVIIWYYLNFFFKNRIANFSVQGDLPKTIN
jgi:hypothetical protein